MALSDDIQAAQAAYNAAVLAANSRYSATVALGAADDFNLPSWFSRGNAPTGLTVSLQTAQTQLSLDMDAARAALMAATDAAKVKWPINPWV